MNHLVDGSSGCKDYAAEFVNEAVECYEVSFVSDSIKMRLLFGESVQWSSHCWGNLHECLCTVFRDIVSD